MRLRRTPVRAVWAILATSSLLMVGCQDAPTGEYRELSADTPEPTTALADPAGDQAPEDEVPADPTLAQTAVETEIEPVEAPLPADSQAGEPSPITPVAATDGVAGSYLAARPAELSQAPAALVPMEPHELKLLIPEHAPFRKEGPKDALRVSYDDLDLLKILNAEPVPLDVVDHMPKWLKDLDGQRIRVRGWMYPPPLSEGLRGFTLARDNQICCFGRDPKPYDLIRVRMREGETTDYIFNRPFDVVGVLHIEPIAAGPQFWEQLYFLDDATVIDR